MLSLCLFGMVLRFWQLGNLPFGLYQDEAINGLDGVTGVLRWYYPANNGREPFYLWLVTLSVQLLGPTAFAVRLPAALMGVILIPAAGGLAYALWRDPHRAWLTAAITALTFWPLALSRIGFRAGTLPVLLTLAALLAVWALHRRSVIWAGLAGLLYSLSFYTYSAARFTPFVLAAFLLWLAWTQRKAWRTWPWRLLGVWSGVVMLAGLPLAALSLTQPDAVFGRLGQVAVTAPAQVLAQLGRALLMFNLSGDTIGRHNLPGRPVFDLLLGLAFLVGLLRAGWQARRGDSPSVLLLLWSLGMLGPTVLADDAPHFLRAVGVLPAVFILAADGLDWATAHLPQRIAPWGLATALTLTAGWTTWDYFGRYTADPETGVWFQQAATALAADLAAETVRPTYLDRRLWDSFPSLRYLLADHPTLTVYDTLPPDNWSQGGDGAVLVVWPYEPFDAALAAIPPGMLIERQGGALYREERQPAAAAYPLYTRFNTEPAPPASALATTATGLALVQAQTAVSADRLIVTVVWRVEQPQPRDLFAFVHVLGADGTPLAVVDGPPLGGDWPMPNWLVGSNVRQVIEISLPLETISSAQVPVGVYDPATGQRMPLISLTGEALDAYSASFAP